MFDTLTHWIRSAADSVSPDLSFLVLAAFVAVVLLAWLSDSDDPQRPGRPELRHWDRARH